MKLKMQSCVEISPEEIKGIMVRRLSSVTYLELVKEGDTQKRHINQLLNKMVDSENTFNELKPNKLEISNIVNKNVDVGFDLLSV